MGKVIQRIQKGKICLKAWENEDTDYLTFSITCKYKKKDSDDWAETKTLFERDLVNMKAAIEEYLDGKDEG